MSDQTEQLVELLRGKRWTALTGAGISTDSGIPDYRGPGAPPRNPMTYQQFTGDPAFRRHYWARNHVGWRHVGVTRPNDGHRALATLEHAGLIAGVITQNVDLLHQAAGSVNVIDLHGHYDAVICLNCGHRMTRTALHDELERLNPRFADEVAVQDVEIAPDADAVIEATEGFRVLDCPVCGGILKPDIVYFGETVPKERVARAYEMVDDGDVLVVLGTSLAVMSGLRFVHYCAKRDKPVAIVNRGRTRGDGYATVKVEAGTSETLTGLLTTLPALL